MVEQKKKMKKTYSMIISWNHFMVLIWKKNEIWLKNENKVKLKLTYRNQKIKNPKTNWNWEKD